MPKPQKYSQSDIAALYAPLFVSSSFSSQPDLHEKSLSQITVANKNKVEKNPVTGFEDNAVTAPEAVAEITSGLEDTYLDVVQDLAKTNPETQPFQYAMRTMFRNYLLITLNGGSPGKHRVFSPFLRSLEGRTPDFIGTDKFTGKPPVLNPDQLWQELKDPARELSGFEEMEIAMKKVPLARLLQNLSDGTLLLYDAMDDSAGMKEEDQEKLRVQILNLAREAKNLAVELNNVSREDMKAFCKVFAPHNREMAVNVQWYGDRGLKSLPGSMELVETAMEKHVPFSHLDTFLPMLETAKRLEKSLELPGLEKLQGTDKLREENRKLLELLNTDFSSFSQEEAAAHMNRIGEAAAARTNALRTVSESLPVFRQLTPPEVARLPQDQQEEYRINENLHESFKMRNVSGNQMTDEYLAGKLSGNTRLSVPKPFAPAPQNDLLINIEEDRGVINARGEVHIYDDRVQADEVFDQGPHLTTVMPEGKTKYYTSAMMGKYVGDVTTFKDRMGTDFFNEAHQERGAGLLGHFRVAKNLPWNGSGHQTLFQNAGEAEIVSYLKSAHDEALKSYLKCSREETPATYAVRSFAEMQTALAYSGELPEKEQTFNPFFSALTGRLPDFIRKDQYTGNPPETDPDKLVRALGQPGRELSGPEEFEVLCRRLPVGELMAELADNAKRLRAYREAGPEMSAKEKEDLRRDMLRGCSRIQELGEKYKTLSKLELAAFSKIFSPHNRQTALQMNTLGKRGIGETVLEPVARMNRVLAANVPGDRVTAYLSAYSILENVKEQSEKYPAAMSLMDDGGAAYKAKMNGLLAQLGTDLSGMTPQEKQQHFETLAGGMTEFLRMGEATVKHFGHLPPNHPDRQKSLDLKKAMTKWSPKAEFIVGALKNGDHYDFDHQPAALQAAPALQQAQNGQPADNMPKNMQEVKNNITNGLEMLSSIYMHLHEEGHSRGMDSQEYKNFRDAVKAIHKAWNPPEERTIDVETKEGRDRARQLFDRAVNAANAYYLKHARRRDISSTYGNVRKNAALTTIDILAPSVMKRYIAEDMETGMNMARDGVIIKQKIGMEELVRNEKAFAALKYANKNSRTYQKAAEQTQQDYQRKEEREAKSLGREASQIRKEDAVNTFLKHRNRR